MKYSAFTTTISAALILAACTVQHCCAEEEELAIDSIRFGQVLADIKKKAKAQGKRLRGPKKLMLGLSNKLKTNAYRVSGGLGPDKNITRTTFHFSPAGKLAGFNIRLKNSKALDAYRKILDEEEIYSDDDVIYKGQLYAGDYDGYDVSFTFVVDKTGKGNNFIRARCLGILDPDLRAAEKPKDATDKKEYETDHDEDKKKVDDALNKVM